jgi:hypothetical protein
VKLAALIMVGVGTTVVLVTFVIMRRKLEELRRVREEQE